MTDSEWKRHPTAIEESLWALRYSYEDDQGDEDGAGLDHPHAMDDDSIEHQSTQQLSSPDPQSAAVDDDVMSIGLDFLLGSGVGASGTGPPLGQDDDRAAKEESVVGENRSFDIDECDQSPLMVPVDSPVSEAEHTRVPPTPAFLTSALGSTESGQTLSLQNLDAKLIAQCVANYSVRSNPTVLSSMPARELTRGEVDCPPSASPVPSWSSREEPPSATSIGAATSTTLSMNSVVTNTTEFRAQAIARFREKKAARSFQKKVRYECRKRIASTRPRIGGRFAKTVVTTTDSKQTGSEK